jgi:hypothetical protein
MPEDFSLLFSDHNFPLYRIEGVKLRPACIFRGKIVIFLFFFVRGVGEVRGYIFFPVRVGPGCQWLLFFCVNPQTMTGNRAGTAGSRKTFGKLADAVTEFAQLPAHTLNGLFRFPLGLPQLRHAAFPFLPALRRLCPALGRIRLKFYLEPGRLLLGFGKNSPELFQCRYIFHHFRR